MSMFPLREDGGTSFSVAFCGVSQRRSPRKSCLKAWIEVSGDSGAVVRSSGFFLSYGLRSVLRISNFFSQWDENNTCWSA